jgi:flagellar motor protein MotB
MAFLRAAWGQASGRQRAVIIVAGLIGVLALGSLAGGGQGTAVPSPTGLAAVGTATASPTTPASTAPTASPAATTSPSPTPEPTPAPTAEPTAKPTPKATPKATPRPTLKIAFARFTSPVTGGANATVTVKTAARARCSIDVEYKSGSSTAAGLGDKTASSAGVASWTWKVGPNTTPGSWPVTVSCSKAGASKSITKYLRVR